MDFKQQALIPRDGGPIYAETDLNSFPVEPWNTFTLLPFLFIAFYWSKKVFSDWRYYKLITLSIPLLLIGFVGGVMYHACRCKQFWFQMDYVPIALLAVLGAVFFWVKLWQRWPKKFCASAAFIVIGFAALQLFLVFLPRQLAISVAYIHLALLLLLPAFVICKAEELRGLKVLVYALLSFSAAIVCRILDFHPSVTSLLPMGSHFLWHIFGAASAHFILDYVYQTNKLDPNSSTY